jgi:hypothetical protein
LQRLGQQPTGLANKSSDYLLASTRKITATGLSELAVGAISHDQITRFLAGEELNEKSLGIGPVEVISVEMVSVSFSVKETGQLFSANYINTVEARGRISVSASLYYVSSESTKTFPAGTSPETIAMDYTGKSEYISASIGPFSISGSDSKQNGWTTNSVSVGTGFGFTLATGEVVRTDFVEVSLNIKH